MSFNVLVIPEDPTWNGYILKPLAKKLMESAGKPKARTVVLSKPRLRGYEHALRAIRDELPDSYGFFDLWLFFPDGDNDPGRGDAMGQLEADLQSRNIPLLCCPAQPEVEIYACVGFQDDLPVGWEDARTHPRMKEEVFAPLLQTHGDPRQAGHGREAMTTRSLQNLPRLFQLCPETQRLCDRIAAHLETL